MLSRTISYILNLLEQQWKKTNQVIKALVLSFLLCKTISLREACMSLCYSNNNNVLLLPRFSRPKIKKKEMMAGQNVHAIPSSSFPPPQLPIISIVFFSFLFFSFLPHLHKLHIIKTTQNQTKNTLKITKQSKTIQNSGKRTSGVAGTVFSRVSSAGTVSARGPHAPPQMAARGSTRRRKNKPKIGGSVTAYSSLQSPAVRHLQISNNTARAIDFKFFSFLNRSAFFSLLLRFGSASLWLQVRPLILSRR